MSLGTKIADKIPDSVLVYADEHPTVLTVVTFALTVVTLSLFYVATDLDIRANAFRRASIAAKQPAASEALGG